MSIPMPSTVDSLDPIREALDAADHEARLAWAYSLGESEQLALFELAADTQLTVDDITHPDGSVFIHPGRNGLAVFNKFQKRFAKLGDAVVGYNHNDNGLVSAFGGPGHFTAYNSPENGREVWIDYRQVPAERHPDFPPLTDNDHGTRSLVFGNMVDKLRRASQHVLIGNAYKDIPNDKPLTLGQKIGSSLPTAPFVLVQPT